MKTTHIATALLALAATHAHAADAVVTSPGGQVALRIADDGSSFSIVRTPKAAGCCRCSDVTLTFAPIQMSPN